MTIPATPVTTINVLTTELPKNIDLKQYTNDPTGTYTTLSLVSVTPPTPEVTLSNVGVLSLTANTPTDSYSVTVDLTAASADNWATRSTAPGVLWSHNFENIEELAQFQKQTSNTHTDPPVLISQLTSAAPYSGNAVRSSVLGGKLVRTGNIGDTRLYLSNVADWPDPASYVDNFGVTRSIAGYAIFVGNDGAASNSNRESVTVTGRGTDGNGPYLQLSTPLTKTWVLDGPYSYATAGDQRGPWFRPYAALPAGANGRAVPDRGYTEALTTARGWSWPILPTSSWWNKFGVSNSSPTGYTGGAAYAHPDYHAHPVLSALGYRFEGSELWYQFRMRISASRWSATSPRELLSRASSAGKNMWLGDNIAATQFGELVWMISGANYNRMSYFYTDIGAAMLGELADPQAGGTTADANPGGDFTANCVLDTNGPHSGCFAWPPDEWVTVMVHIVPGHHNKTTHSNLVLASPSNDAGAKRLTFTTAAPTPADIETDNINATDYFVGWAASTTWSGAPSLRVVGYTSNGTTATWVVGPTNASASWPASPPSSGVSVTINMAADPLPQNNADTGITVKIKRTTDPAWLTLMTGNFAINFGHPNRGQWVNVPPGWDAVHLGLFWNLNLANVPPDVLVTCDYAEVIFGTSEIPIPTT